MRDFAPHQQALELKELGFDELCFGYYVDGELRGINLGMEELGGVEPYYQRFGFHTLSNHDIDNPNKIVVTAPTYSQAFTWFREKYQIDSWIYPNLNGLYSVSIVRRGVGLGKVSEYQTYPEAELDCLIKLIEITKTK